MKGVDTRKTFSTPNLILAGLLKMAPVAEVVALLQREKIFETHDGPHLPRESHNINSVFCIQAFKK